MKEILLLCCLFFLLKQLAKGQQTDLSRANSPQALHDNYILRYKSQKTTGWVLLGSGIGMLIGGGAVYASYASQGFNGPAPTVAELLFFIIGPGAAIASIPFFLFAKNNKTKAKLVLKSQPVTFGNKILLKSNYTALTLTIQL